MITLADVSEFQINVDAPTYLVNGHTCLIARAHNGWRPDNRWPARRDYLRKYKFDALGWYQYLVEGKDAAQQAQEFIATVGRIQPNEFLILDHEEGSGDQTGRAEVWFNIVDAHYKKISTLYSGEYFGRDNLGGWARWKRPRWMAAYQGSQPTDPHELWQNTDRGIFPGIGSCDGSIFNSNAQDFVRVFCQTTPIPHPPLPKPIKEGEVIHAAVKSDDRIELFYEADDGEVLHTWQPQPNGGWAGAQTGKRNAGWQSMGYPQKDRM